MLNLPKKLKNFNINEIIASIIIIFMLLYAVFAYCENFLEPKAYDLLIRLTSHKIASNNIVIVDIDDASISKIGRWPWDRTNFSNIFEYLEKYSNPKIIAFDARITSYGKPRDDKEFVKKIKQFKKLVIGVSFSRQSSYFEKNPELDEVLSKKFTVNVEDKRSKKQIEQGEYNNSSYSIKEILLNVSGVGSVLSTPDKDGIIREIEPIVYYKGHYYPSLALKIFSNIYNNPKFLITDNSLTCQSNNNINIPIINHEGIHSLIKWYRPLHYGDISSHKRYKAWEILKSFEQIKNGEKPMISPALFKDKIVIVGATASTIADIKSTPIRENYPGVDIQATSVDNILNNDFMQKPVFIVRFAILILILSISLAAVLLLSPLHSALFVMLLMLGYVEICLNIAYPNNYAFDVITPLVFAFCAITIGYGYKYFIEDSRKKQIEKIMAKYVSKDVMTDILKNIGEVKLGGKRAEITALFADIRDFTSISESVEPEEISSILNLYFSEMVPIVKKHHGMINKFMGDAMLAVFGAPIESKDHAKNAVLCAMEMLEKQRELQQRWKEEGKSNISIGIGISSGIAFVGNIGAEDRLEYTAIGDTVNIASRLESFNKLYNTKLLISAHTYEKVKDLVDVIKIHSVTVKGKTESLDIFEIIRLL